MSEQSYKVKIKVNVETFELSLLTFSFTISEMFMGNDTPWTVKDIILIGTTYSKRSFEQYLDWV